MSQEQNKDMNQYFYRASAAEFIKIPGVTIAYWLSERKRKLFEMPKISCFAKVGDGMQTGENAKYIRYWFEVSLDKSSLQIGSEKREKWIPCNKGGDYRKWFGNTIDVINWERDGWDIKNLAAGAYIRNEEEYFKPAVTWSRITSGSLSFRAVNANCIHNDASCFMTGEPAHLNNLIEYLNSKIAAAVIEDMNPTLNLLPGQLNSTPYLSITNGGGKRCIEIAREDWNLFEVSWEFSDNFLAKGKSQKIEETWLAWLARCWQATQELQALEEKNNDLLINTFGLQDELTKDIPLREITLTCNPHYRYGGNRSEEELETLLQCDTLRELVSYALGCMMGRYSLDKPGLILASQGETLQDYLRQIPTPRFTPDDDAILPLTDQEWFTDDATNRFREFIRLVWGEEHLQQNLDFVAESLCLHAIKPKKGEASLDTIRRYLSTQFFKDHLRTYKKRPIYWLFSSGKHKAFECLVYLHRYNEGTLARMRTEYVIPLTAKLSTYAAKLEKDVEASTSTAEKKRLEKELTTLHHQQAELAAFDETLRHYADQRISLDLDEGVKVNYGKFGDLLAEVKAVTGGAADD